MLNSVDRDEIVQGCLEQAQWAAKLGSPMYEALLLRIAEDVRAVGPCLTALGRQNLRSRMLPPLLLLAAIHRMVLDGRLPEAAPFYPSVGGKIEVEALWPIFLAAVSRAVLPPCVQTNEIGRANALLPGFVEIHRRTGLPLRLLEIGASAGLNLRWDHFPFLDTPPGIRIVERRGCDLDPIDPTLDEGRLSLLSFVWPDQSERLHALAEVIDIARRVPATVDRCDAVEWLGAQLAESRPGVATVVFHSVVWPYLSA
jgi:hypothetical protein